MELVENGTNKFALPNVMNFVFRKLEFIRVFSEMGF